MLNFFLIDIYIYFTINRQKRDETLCNRSLIGEIIIFFYLLKSTNVDSFKHIAHFIYVPQQEGARYVF